MIRFRNVSRVYKTGTEALHKVNLKINDGEFVFIIGHSGAGKSTMVRLLMCEDVPTEGDIIINGINTRNLTPKKIPKFRRSLGIVFQDFRLIPNLNVFDNIAFAMRVVGKSRKQINKKVKSVLSLVGLTHKTYDFPSNLSGGEQQRVALARAIVNNPKVVIADEPTGNVDPQMSYDIMKMLLAINKRGITVIVVTHEHEFIKAFQKRVVVLEEGEIISDSASPNGSGASSADEDEDLFFDGISDDDLMADDGEEDEIREEDFSDINNSDINNYDIKYDAKHDTKNDTKNDTKEETFPAEKNNTSDRQDIPFDDNDSDLKESVEEKEIPYEGKRFLDGFNDILNAAFPEEDKKNKSSSRVLGDDGKGADEK